MKIFDRLKKLLLKKENDAHEFEPLLTEIEQSPANPLGNTVFWIVILFILFASLWMYFGKVDVVVTSRGIIIPDGEEKTLGNFPDEERWNFWNLDSYKKLVDYLEENK